jgi:hypothetical protein
VTGRVRRGQAPLRAPAEAALDLLVERALAGADQRTHYALSRLLRRTADAIEARAPAPEPPPPTRREVDAYLDQLAADVRERRRLEGAWP